MYAMIYDDDGQFAIWKASEDEAKLIAARALAETSFDVFNPGCTQEEYEDWLRRHEEELMDTINYELNFEPDTMSFKAARYRKFKEEAQKDLNRIMLEAVQIKGRTISRVCIFCCETLHQRDYQRGINKEGHW